MGEDHRVDESEPGCDPSRRERRDGREKVGSEEDRPEQRRLDAELQVEPVGHQALRDEAATEGIEREEERQLQDDALRSMETETGSDPVIADACRRRLDTRTEPPRT